VGTVNYRGARRECLPPVTARVSPHGTSIECIQPASLHAYSIYFAPAKVEPSGPKRTASRSFQDMNGSVDVCFPSADSSTSLKVLGNLFSDSGVFLVSSGWLRPPRQFIPSSDSCTWFSVYSTDDWVLVSFYTIHASCLFRASKLSRCCRCAEKASGLLSFFVPQ